MGFSQVFRRSIPCLCSVPRPRSNRRALAITVTSMLPPLCAQRRLRATLDFGANPQLQHLLSYASCFALPLTRKARFRLAGSAFAVRESNPLDRYERFQLVLTIILPSCSPDASAIKRLRPTTLARLSSIVRLVEVPQVRRLLAFAARAELAVDLDVIGLPLDKDIVVVLGAAVLDPDW